jgi:hypothetical protein
MPHDQTGTSVAARRHVLTIAAALVASGVSGSDKASAANAKTLKRKVKDIKGELHRMGADVKSFEQMADRLGAIPGLEDMEADLRVIIASLDSKRRIALSR